MSKLPVTEGDRLRAVAYVNATREIMTEGVQGAEGFGPLQTLAQWQQTNQAIGLEATLRRTFYAQLAAFRSDQYEVFEPEYQNNWAHLGGSFDTRVLLWVDANGLKHIEGSCTRTSGSAVNNEVLFTVPDFMRSSQDGKIWIVPTSNNAGRLDLIGNEVRWRTTGGYTGGSGYVSFDSVPPYR